MAVEHETTDRQMHNQRLGSGLRYALPLTVAGVTQMNTDPEPDRSTATMCQREVRLRREPANSRAYAGVDTAIVWTALPVFGDCTMRPSPA